VNEVKRVGKSGAGWTTRATNEKHTTLRQDSATAKLTAIPTSTTSKVFGELATNSAIPDGELCLIDPEVGANFWRPNDPDAQAVARGKIARVPGVRFAPPGWYGFAKSIAN